MRSLIAFLLLILLGQCLHAQQAAALDSIRMAVDASKNPEEKVYWMDRYALAMMNISPGRADSIGKKLIEFAEETRDRRLMVKAYMANGMRLAFFGGNLERQKLAIEYYHKALQIAEANKLEDLRGGILVRLASIHATMLEKDKALNLVNQAASVVSNLKNDSLHAEVQLTYGNVYLARNEKILALRFYLNGLRIAEKIKNYSLRRIAYSSLSKFYSGIEDYDKAIDYATEAYRMLEHINEKNVPYQRVIDISSIGNLYSYKKSYDIAINHFNRAIAMADTLRFTNLKMPAYMSLFNQYLRRNQPAEALKFFNSADGEYLKSQLRTFGMSAVIDQAYGITYTALGKYDSARICFQHAAPFFEKSSNVPNQMYFYYNKAVLFKEMDLADSAIFYYERLREMGGQTGTLENVQAAARELDSLYASQGDYRRSREYYAMYNLYKDSIETLGREKELAQEEVADEAQRQARLEEERIEQEKRRNNIQYLGIVLGIFGLFVALVVLGMFKVSATVIRGIGFFAFLLFFEFIFLIFKKNIYSITHGEPWKDLAFMIGLAAILVPLHHFLEKRVLHYLTSHNRLTGMRERIFRKSGSQGS
jgi:tetratricopeptide (TPR) repeat protein